MEDIFSIIVSILEALLPKRFTEWLFTIPKPFRYVFIVLFYGSALALYGLAILLLCRLYHKITGFYF